MRGCHGATFLYLCVDLLSHCPRAPGLLYTEHLEDAVDAAVALHAAASCHDVIEWLKTNHFCVLELNKYNVSNTQT